MTSTINNKLTIEQIKEHKTIAQKKILEIIQNLEVETGLEITDIKVLREFDKPFGRVISKKVSIENALIIV